MSYLFTRIILLVWGWGIVIFLIALVARLLLKDELPASIPKMIVGTIFWPVLLFSKNGRRILFKNIKKL